MQKLIKRAKNQKGFTLVELMVVVVIIGILVAIAVPVYNNVTLSAKQKAHDSNLRIIDGAVQQYKAANSDTPPTDIATLVNGSYLTSTPEVPIGISVGNPAATTDADSAYSLSTNKKARPLGTWTDKYDNGAD